MAKEIEKVVRQTTPIEPTTSIGGQSKEQTNTGKNFSKILEETPDKGEKAGAISPQELVAQGKINYPKTLSPETINKQISSVSSVLGDVRRQLTKKGMKLRPAQEYLLNSKLNQAQKNIYAASQKFSKVPLTVPTENDQKNPLDRFIALVSDSQSQLVDAQSEIKKITRGKKTMEPGELLLVQIKLAKAQQQLEYSSILLNTAVSDVKTLFNIQL